MVSKVLSTGGEYSYDSIINLNNLDLGIGAIFVNYKFSQNRWVVEWATNDSRMPVFVS